MHELGIVKYVADQIVDVAKENNLKKVSSVTLQFGEVSGIVPEQLIDAWAWYAKKFPILDGSVMKAEVMPAVTWCNSCQMTYETVKYGKICPYCGSGETWLQSGNETVIKEIEAE